MGPRVIAPPHPVGNVRECPFATSHARHIAELAEDRERFVHVSQRGDGVVLVLKADDRPGERDPVERLGQAEPIAKPAPGFDLALVEDT